MKINGRFSFKFNIFDAETEKNVAALIWASRRSLAHSKWEVKGGSGYSIMVLNGVGSRIIL